MDGLKLGRPPGTARHQRVILITALVAALALGLSAWLHGPTRRAMFSPPPDAARPLSPLEIDVRNVMPLPRAAALARNAAIPLAPEPSPAAAPFLARFARADARLRSLECLTQAVYYEAGQEPAEGQQAVAQIILNRVRHPAFPNSICGVVYQGSNRRTGCQFTFTCDGALARTPSASGWARARRVAEAALSGEVYAPVGFSTHYHADYVVPYWASSLVKTAVVGAHIFYRWPGSAGRAGAFTAHYAGLEPVLGQAVAVAPAEIAIDNPALIRTPPAVPEERAEEIDDFGLLSPRANRPAPNSMRPPVDDMEDVLRAANGPVRRSPANAGGR